jgi:hypothetical protein
MFEQHYHAARYNNLTTSFGVIRFFNFFIVHNPPRFEPIFVIAEGPAPQEYHQVYQYDLTNGDSQFSHWRWHMVHPLFIEEGASLMTKVGGHLVFKDEYYLRKDDVALPIDKVHLLTPQIEQYIQAMLAGN